jgi:hypothetical protein
MTGKNLKILFLIVVFLPACAGVPLSTMFKLKGMDPIEADPAQIKIAIRADERLVIREGGVSINLKFDADDGSLNIDDTYLIDIIRNPVLSYELMKDNEAGEVVTLFQLSDSDARKMQYVQSQLRPFKGEGRGGALSFGVDLKDVCADSPMPDGEVLVDIFIQTATKSGFIPLNKNLNVRQSRNGEDSRYESFADCSEPLKGGAG